jgi:hypothetical protein
MSLVRGTSEMRMPLMTAPVVLPEIRDITFPLVGLDPEPVISVAPNWKERRMRGLAQMRTQESYSDRMNPPEKLLGVRVVSG